ncbi:MAG: transglutaminase-like domain-containing protein, partial [Planctomycetes bacterium]|nr:transglutaminase-like domain-containing protein [Planctomycetota bacterium]
RLIYQVLSVSFVLFTGLYLTTGGRGEGAARRERSGRGGKAAVRAVALIAVALVAWEAADALYRHERTIEEFIGRFLTPSQRQTSGFSTSGLLGTVIRQQDADENAIALIATSKERPGYLRGKAFDAYYHGGWRTTPFKRDVSPHPDPPDELARLARGRPVFTIRPQHEGPRTMSEIWPEASLEGTLFLPLETTHVSAAADVLGIDLHEAVASDALVPAHPYRAFVADELPAGYLSSARIQELTQLPDAGTATGKALNAVLDQVAAEIFTGRRSTREKVAAVVQHFRRQYGYDRGVTIPPGRDPMEYFLRERPAAHCEYFASAAALLLRRGGVPARYVTGFVAAERHRFGDYWVARNKDAHAWVEAWDDQRGWQIVEATPPAGQPLGEQISAATGFWEWLRLGFHRFRIRLKQEGLRGLLAALWSFATSIPGVLILLTLALYLRKRLAGRTSGRRRAKPVEPHLRELHELLARLDRRLAACGFRRVAGETLHQFAARLEAAAGNDVDLLTAATWYRRYAGARYGSVHTADPATMLRDLPRPRPRRLRPLAAGGAAL